MSTDRNKPAPFSLKDHFNIEDDLPHFGLPDRKQKPSQSQPDLYLNKSFHFTTNKNFTSENEKTPTGAAEDRSVLDQSVNSCLICFDKKPNAVFMDCGHGGENLKLIIYLKML